jgi:hypothetical protein
VINVGAADGSKWAVLYHNPCDGDELEPGFHAARNLPKMTGPTRRTWKENAPMMNRRPGSMLEGNPGRAQGSDEREDDPFCDDRKHDPADGPQEENDGTSVRPGEEISTAAGCHSDLCDPCAVVRITRMITAIIPSAIVIGRTPELPRNFAVR